MFAAPEDDMRATAAVSAVRPRHVVVFGMRKMLAAGPAVTRPAKDPDLIDKI
jgi:hypothetical protein